MDRASSFYRANQKSNVVFHEFQNYPGVIDQLSNLLFIRAFFLGTRHDDLINRDEKLTMSVQLEKNNSTFINYNKRGTIL